MKIMKTIIHTLIFNTTAFTTLAAILLLNLSSCDSFVEVGQPNSQLTAAAVFESKATANAAMADIYAQIRENGILSGKLSGASLLLGTYADELISYETGAYSTASFYNNAVLASNPVITSLWNETYRQIYAANSVYWRVGNSTMLTTNEKAQLQGEALFVRAISHFYLANLFGAVPYVTGTDYQKNNTIARTPVQTVYNLVTADLKTAITLLPEAYPTPERARPNKAVAQALLARVLLYNQSWTEAANMASAVINQTATYNLETDLDRVFLRGSSSTIWQLASAYEGKNTDEGSAMIFTSGPPAIVALAETFVSGFEPNDQRRIHWIAEVTDGTSTWYHAFKYKQKDDTGASEEFSIILRLEEQYLVRAEARAKQNDLTGAKEDLDIIRNRAGLASTTAATAQEVIDAVMAERKAELFTEHGHRFFDLKRTERLNTELAAKPGWEATDGLWPLPQAELQVNPLLAPQNPGY